MLDTSFLSPAVFCFFFYFLKRFLHICCFRFSSPLSGACSGADAQPGSFIFLIDPTPYRIPHCNPASDSLTVFPAMGIKKSGFLAPKSNVWIPPKLLQPQAVNTEAMECDAYRSPSPVPPPCSCRHRWLWHVNISGSYMFSLLLHWQLCRF